MSLQDFKLTGKEIFVGASLVSGFFFQWYTLKMEIRESILNAGFEKRTNENHFNTLDAKVDVLENRTNSLENKMTRIFTLLYRDADKPKRIQIESEE